MLKIREISYGAYGNCLELDNGNIRALVTLEVGPRVIWLSLCGENNIFCEDLHDHTCMEGGKFAEVFGARKWHLYGGHRLWISPEHNPLSYYPDNEPVAYRVEKNTVTFTPPPQTECGWQLEMALTVSPDCGEITVTHRVTNLAKTPVTLSPWAMTVMAENSVTIVPQTVRDTGLLHNRSLSLWAYTDLRDERLMLGNQYITLRQVPGAVRNIKLGLNCEDGWLAVQSRGQLFIKRFAYEMGAAYPDNGCNCEVFSNFFMTEAESLGKLETLQTGQTAVHTEHWEVLPCTAEFDEKSEDSTGAFVGKYIKKP